MIDYEKLKQAVEIAQESKNYWFRIDFAVWEDSRKLDIRLFNSHASGEYFLSGFDELLLKLKELTKPEPKFRVGDTVWVIKKDKPIMADIINIEDGVCHVSYDGGHSHIEGKYIYSSRKELIDAQIKHWQSLKEPEEKPPIYDMKSFVSSEEKEPDKVFHKPKINDEDFEKFLKGFADKRHNQCEHDNNGEYLKPDGFPQYTRKCIKCGQFY